MTKFLNDKISFYLCVTYILIVYAEDICCTRSHSMTHTHTQGKTPPNERSARPETSPPVHNTTFKRNRQPCPWRDSKPQVHQTSDSRPNLSPRGHRDRQRKFTWGKKIVFYAVPLQRLSKVKKN
jgi:hypothetical protein